MICDPATLPTLILLSIGVGFFLGGMVWMAKDAKNAFFCATCGRWTEHKLTRQNEWLCSLCGLARET